VAEASRANVGEVSATNMTQAMTQAGPADMTQGSCANVTAAKMHAAEMTATKMHAAEMTATTEVATTTVAAAAAACKGVSRETQRAKCDARQQHSCCLGHHDFSPDIGPRVCTRRSFSRIYVCAHGLYLLESLVTQTASGASRGKLGGGHA
jgi:hypothetical protein